MNTLLVAIGGAVGSVARYHAGLFATHRWPRFPWGTLFVNALGSLLLAALMFLVLEGRLQDEARVALGVGVMGGFTTYSTFNYETMALVQAGSYGRAATYVAMTLIACLAGGALGWLAARQLC